LTLALIVIAGFRSHVGADYDSYVVWYIDKRVIVILNWAFSNSKSISVFGLSHYYFFLLSLFFIFFFYLGLRKYTVNANVALLSFLLLPGLF
jgi:hypothetical protein